MSPAEWTPASGDDSKIYWLVFVSCFRKLKVEVFLYKILGRFGLFCSATAMRVWRGPARRNCISVDRGFYRLSNTHWDENTRHKGYNVHTSTASMCSWVDANKKQVAILEREKSSCGKKSVATCSEKDYQVSKEELWRLWFETSVFVLLMHPKPRNRGRALRGRRQNGWPRRIICLPLIHAC